MTRTEALTIFKEYIDDSSYTSETFIEQSLYLLNNYFSQEFVDTSNNTTSGNSSVSEPTGTKEIKKIFIDGEEVKKLRDEEDLNALIDAEVQRWYRKAGTIYFIKEFEEDNLTIKIEAQKKYTWPSSTDTDMDLENELQDLLMLGAQIRYIRSFLNKTRSESPDFSPQEVIEYIKELQKQYKKTVEEIKKARKNE